MGDRAFAVAAPRAWNSLPDAIRRSPSLATLFENSLLYPVFLLASFLLPIVRSSLTLYSVLEVTVISIYDSLISTILHYIIELSRSGAVHTGNRVQDRKSDAEPVAESNR